MNWYDYAILGVLSFLVGTVQQIQWRRMEELRTTMIELAETILRKSRESTDGK